MDLSLEKSNAELIITLENATPEAQNGSRSAGTVYVGGTSELMLSCKCIVLLFHLPQDPGNRCRLLELIFFLDQIESMPSLGVCPHGRSLRGINP